MSEFDALQRSGPWPCTVESMSLSLRDLGLREGMTLLVHSSLSSLGWVCGGPVAVIQALLGVLGPRGTLMMPTHSGEYSDPEPWQHPPVPREWWDTIRRHMPPFDPRCTPCRGMGVIPETFRHFEGVVRSCHPHTSFAALGPDAEFLCGSHTLDYGMGEGSPLARLYDLGGYVLLLGVGHDHNTSLHLAEYRAAWGEKKTTAEYAPVLLDGQRVWKKLENIQTNADDFAALGRDFEASVVPGTGARAGKRAMVGQAPCLLVEQRSLVDFAVLWMEKNR